MPSCEDVVKGEVSGELVVFEQETKSNGIFCCAGDAGLALRGATTTTAEIDEGLMDMGLEAILVG